MHDHARGFVDDCEIVVLVQELERNVLRGGGADIGLRDLELDDIARNDTVGGVGGAAVDAHEVALDQARGGGAAQVLRMLGEKPIQP
jgi:hypothetical protein